MNKKWICRLLLIAIILGMVFAAETAYCTRVAVIDFESIGDMPDIGRAVTEIVRTELIKTGKYEVVERALLNKLLEEQRFQLSDLVDPTKAVELGKMLGADLILTGSVVKIGSGYTINARFIDVKTGAAKRAEAIRGYDIDELTYMSIKLIGILEQKVKPTPVTPPAPLTPPEQRPERPYVPVPPRMEVKRSPRSYITVSLGGASFLMEELNKDAEPDYRIENGPDIEMSFANMVTENIGVGLGVGYLAGSTSMTDYQYDSSYNLIKISADEKVSGTFLSLRPLFRHELGDNIALCLGGDIGGIRLALSRRIEISYLGTEYHWRVEGSGTGPLFGAFVSGQLLIGNFFLQGDLGFRSAKGDVKLELVEEEIELDSELFGSDYQELDFSGPYLLLTAGVRF